MLASTSLVSLKLYGFRQSYNRHLTHFMSYCRRGIFPALFSRDIDYGALMLLSFWQNKKKEKVISTILNFKTFCKVIVKLSFTSILNYSLICQHFLYFKSIGYRIGKMFAFIFKTFLDVFKKR